LQLVPDWEGLLSSGEPNGSYEDFRRHERTGRPLGSDDFISRLEKLTGRVLRKQKPGPKKKNGDN